MNDQYEILQIINLIPYKTFNEKIKITRKYLGKAKITVEDKYILVVTKEKCL